MANYSQQHASNSIRLQPCVIALTGPPLMGKTTLAKKLKKITNLLILDIDSMKKFLNAKGFSQKIDFVRVITIDTENPNHVDVVWKHLLAVNEGNINNK